MQYNYSSLAADAFVSSLFCIWISLIFPQAYPWQPLGVNHEAGLLICLPSPLIPPHFYIHLLQTMNITPPAVSNVTQLAITVTSTMSAELRAELAYNLVCFLLALIMTILVLYAAFFCLCLMFDWWPCCKFYYH